MSEDLPEDVLLKAEEQVMDGESENESRVVLGNGHNRK